MKIAIHTVFILKENILFLEEWIYYHILLGFNKFYLYNNSKINKVTGFDNKPNHKIIENKVNKYGINYDKIVNMTDTQMNKYVQKLCEKYKCIEIIEWSPTDKEGNILYNQKEAHNHCLKTLKRDKIDWCANIDMDEYIIIKDFDNIEKYISSLPRKIKNIKLGQIRFDSRFNNVDKLVTDITDCEIKDLNRNHSNKNIYNVKNTIEVNVHSIKLNNFIFNFILSVVIMVISIFPMGGLSQLLETMMSTEYRPSTKEIWFNHYKMNQNSYKHVNNINVNIKTKLNKYSFITLK
tara:strand:+ start:20144 stop:21022 length:879 start_codon:yes stop_codon:yes gene_type:complete